MESLRDRLQRVMERAVERRVKVTVDAEQIRYQAAIGDLTRELMSQYNRVGALVFHTYQAYLTTTNGHLFEDLHRSLEQDWVLGVKLAPNLTEKWYSWQ